MPTLQVGHRVVTLRQALPMSGEVVAVDGPKATIRWANGRTQNYSVPDAYDHLFTLDDAQPPPKRKRASRKRKRP